MSGDAQRDVDESPFSAILARLNGRYPEVVVAVFYDEEGETIDYYSQLDPFDTRLTAAHHGVVICSATQRAAWLGLGTVEALEVHADRSVTITLPVGSGTFLTIVVNTADPAPELAELIDEVVVQLRLEAGV